MAVLPYLASGVLGFGASAIKGGAQGPLSRAMAQAFNFNFPNELPSIEQILWLYRAGWITATEATNLAKLVGVPFDPSGDVTSAKIPSALEPLRQVWNAVWVSQEPQLSPGELDELLFRRDLDPADYKTLMRRNGWFDHSNLAKRVVVGREIPSPQQIAQWSMRGAFDKTIAETFRLDEEKDSDYRYWGTKSRLEYDARNPEDVADGVQEYTWSDLIWRDHWQQPGIQQVMDIYRRLRPSGGPDGGPRDASGEVMTERELNLYLSSSGYSPYWRDKLAAITYSIPGIRQAKQLDQFGVVKFSELVEVFQDNGYNRTNAERMATMVRRSNDHTRYKAELSGARGKVLEAYTVGTIDHDAAAVSLYQIGLQTHDDAAEFSTKSPQDQQSIATADPGIELELAAVDAGEQARLAKAAIDAARKMYLSGRASRAETFARLTYLGIAEDRKGQYLTYWDQTFGPPRRELSAEKVLHYFRVGIINASTAAQRLINLGWELSDIPLMLADTIRDIELDLAKAAEKVARTEKEKRKALEAAAKAAQKEHEDTVKRLAKTGGPSNLKRWLIRGLIGPDEVLSRLASMDWPAGDAQEFVATALQDREKHLCAARAAAAKGKCT